MADISKAVPYLPTPSTDLAKLTDLFGQAWGVTCGESVLQYLAWSESAGIFKVLAGDVGATLQELAAQTVLNECGTDVFLRILASLDLVVNDGGRYRLSSLATEYLLEDSPYYAGYALYMDLKQDLPPAFLKDQTVGVRPLDARPAWPLPLRLRIQHSRNFAPTVVAVRTGEFNQLKHVIDIAGGSGVLAIPLALDHPDVRITLVELPSALDGVQEFIEAYGIDLNVRLAGMDVLVDDWSFGPCDGIFFGNFFHANDDAACGVLARKAFEALPAGGRVWLHEVLFNEDRSGPLLAALWNANMSVRRKGARQRTASELSQLLQSAGFIPRKTIPTAGHFSLVSGEKPFAPEPR